MNYWIGQAFGIVATIAGISIPVFKKKWQMLVLSICNNVFCALNLIFLDAIGSGIFLFAVATVQAGVNLVHALHNTSGKALEKIIFVALYLGLGFYGLFTAPDYVSGINARNLLELLPIIAAVMNMLFVFSRGENKARVFFILCNALWLVYFIIIRSTSGFGAGFSVASGLVALIVSIRKGAAKKGA